MGEALDIDPTQVRKDFGAIGLMGISRVGYKVCEVCGAIRTVFGFNRPNSAVLVGAGQLGSALLTYRGFARYGLRIVAAFDNDLGKTGTEIGGVRVKSTRSLKSYVQNHGIKMAILTTPVGVSQSLTNRLVDVGVKAIWNFSPTRLHAPPDVLIRNEHISLGLAQVAYHLNLRIICVKKLTNSLTVVTEALSLICVNFFAILRNRFDSAGFSGIGAPTGEARTETSQGLQVALPMRNRLARMLRPQPGQMIDPICLVKFDEPMMMGHPRRSDETPRGDVVPRGFPFFDFFREIFHR
jgi:redox-sensing transcriptional repressor